MCSTLLPTHCSCLAQVRHVSLCVVHVHVRTCVSHVRRVWCVFVCTCMCTYECAPSLPPTLPPRAGTTPPPPPAPPRQLQGVTHAGRPQASSHARWVARCRPGSPGWLASLGAHFLGVAAAATFFGGCTPLFLIVTRLPSMWVQGPVGVFWGSPLSRTAVLPSASPPPHHNLTAPASPASGPNLPL